MSLSKLCHNHEYDKPLLEIIMDQESLSSITGVNEVLTISDSTYIIKVYGDEGMTPHFHILSTESHIDTCIKFEKVEWFKHGKHIYLPKTRNQIKCIHEILSSKYKLGGLSNYSALALSWNSANQQQVIDVETIPNYKKLPL